jgi:hypothetical protein
MSARYVETQYGFEYGPAHIQRAFSDDKKGWVLLMLETPKHTGKDSIHIYVTKTGKIRIHNANGGEWTPPNEEPKP